MAREPRSILNVTLPNEGQGPIDPSNPNLAGQQAVIGVTRSDYRVLPTGGLGLKVDPATGAVELAFDELAAVLPATANLWTAVWHAPSGGYGRVDLSAIWAAVQGLDATIEGQIDLALDQLDAQIDLWEEELLLLAADLDARMDAAEDAVAQAVADVADKVEQAPDDGIAYIRLDGSWEPLAWSLIAGIPATFPPSAHTHPWSDLTDVPATFPPSAHTHPVSDVTGLQAALDAKAPLASPAFTGNPTAPTQSTGNNSTRIATTAFVMASFNAGLNNTALTGNPTAPTQAAGNNSTRLANTAFVQQELAAALAAANDASIINALIFG